MRKRREFLTKMFAGAMSAAMVVGTLPVTAMAVEGDKVAADGTYSAKKSVAYNDEAIAWGEDEDWDLYDVTVNLTVKDGKFSDIVVEPSDDYDTSNRKYLGWAYTGDDAKHQGIKTKLLGQPATAETIENWDTVSGATCTSAAVKDAALEAIHKADEAVVAAPVEVAALNEKIADAEALTKDDYTGESWAELEKALTAAKAAAEAKESQDAVDGAAANLQKAIEGLVEEAKVRYVMMNVPYELFFQAYGLTDANIENIDGVKYDAISTATTSKFLGTDGLAEGTYNDGKNILGVTIPVAVDRDTYKTLDGSLKATQDFYYTDLESAPAYYSTLTVGEDGSYSFSAMEQNTKINTGSISLLKDADGNPADLLTNSYGDYYLELEGLTPDGKITATGVDLKIDRKSVV